MSALDAKLAVRRSDALEDWWVIERAEHDGRAWEEVHGCVHYMHYSSDINSASVEGTADEMLAIADAIERHDDYETKRCACHWSEDGVDLWSPHNSHIATLVTHARALELAAEIRREVRP